MRPESVAKLGRQPRGHGVRNGRAVRRAASSSRSGTDRRWGGSAFRGGLWGRHGQILQRGNGTEGGRRRGEMAAVMGWGLRTLRVLDRREQTQERRSWRFELSFFSGLLILLLSLLLPAKNASVSPSVQVPRLLCSGTNLVLNLGTTAAPKHPAGTEPGRAAGVSPGLLQRARSSLGLRVRTGSHSLPSPLRPPGHPSPGRLARTGCSHQRDPGIREPRSCRQDPTCHAPLPPPLRSAAPLLAPLRPGRTPLCMHAPRHTLTRSQLCSAGSCTAHRVCTTHRAHSARPAHDVEM